MFRKYLNYELSPGQLCLAILAIVFACEYVVMLILPYLQSTRMSPSLTALIDACLLTTMLVPLFWLMIARPLHRMAKVRAALLDQVFTTQEEERGRIARDLHDEIGQSFTTVLLGLRSLESSTDPQFMRQRLSEMTELISNTLNEVRRIARGLRPSVLDHLGPVQALEQFLNDFGKGHDFEIDFHVNGILQEARWSPKIEITMYRLVQECLTNVARHAQARHVRIELQQYANLLHVSVSDDGCGFASLPTELNSPRKPCMGLLGMLERVTALHGAFQIESSPGQGTTVSFTIPLFAQK